MLLSLFLGLDFFEHFFFPYCTLACHDGFNYYLIHFKTGELRNAVYLLFIYRRGPGVSCVLQFSFRADRYDGVIALQDALTMKNMLHTMAVKTEYISSSDGKGTNTNSALLFPGFSSSYFA